MSGEKPIDGVCSKCGAKAKIQRSHIGRPHKKCGNRKPGTSRKECGKWEEA